VVGARRAGLTPGALAGEVRAALADLTPGAAVVAGVSGGADSAGLVLLVRAARPDLRITAVHVRHGLRDDAADAAAAAALALALDLGWREEHLAVEPAGEGPEAAARAARYAALAVCARGAGAAAVLVGHTADDQAETVLLALGRGAGLRGLSGMAPRRRLPAPPAAGGGGEAGREVVLVRPLLHLRREDVRGAVREAGLATVEDPTNADVARRRNLVRHRVLPALGGVSGGGGDPVALLARTADLLRDDADLLDGLAGVEAARLIGAWGPVRHLRADALARLHPALRRRVVRALLAAVSGGLAGIDAAAVDRALALPPGGATQVPGGARVDAGGGWLAAAPPGPADLPSRPLPVPGELALPELGLVLTAAPAPAGSGRVGGVPGSDLALPPRSVAPGGADGACAVVVPAAGDLVVRARRDGDPEPGRPGRRLGDRLTDLGVPRPVRGLLPVVGTADGTPLWVPGVAAAPAPPGAPGVRLSITLARPG